MTDSRPPRSLFARALMPLIALLWPLFLVWTALVAAVWAAGFGRHRLDALVTNPELHSALAATLKSMDAIWLTLAAVNAYLALCSAEGLASARRWTAVTLVTGALIGLSSAAKGFPLGPVAFPKNLGPQLGPVPLGLPLLWFVVVTGARDLGMRLFPKAGHLAISGLAGIFALLTDVNLEPVVWKWREWWLWWPADFSAPFHPPWQNFATWLFAGAGLAWCMRSESVVPRAGARRGRAAIVLACINGVCALAHAVHFLLR